jgi:hypothetical protein
MSFKEGGNSGGIRKQTVEWKGREIIFGAKEGEEQKWKRGKERRASEVVGRRDGNGRRAVGMGTLREQRQGKDEMGNCNKEAKRYGKEDIWESSSQIGSMANRWEGRDGKRTSITGLRTETGEGQRSE